MSKEKIMQVKPINSFYENYKMGLFDKRELEAKLFQFILDNPDYFGLYFYKRDKDELRDFLCWLYPRLSKSIDRFERRVACFDTYLNSVVRYGEKEFRRRQGFCYGTDYAVCNVGANEMIAAETEAVYGPDPEPEPEPPVSGAAYKTVSNPRQTLTLLLKSYYLVTDDFVERVAPSLGMTQQAIFKMIDELRALRREKERKPRELRERCFHLHFRCVSFEKRLHDMDKGDECYQPLYDKIESCRSRLVRMRQRLKNMRIEASNKEIAQVLGVTKGTVDANLYAIKQHLKRTERADAAPPLP
jgi:biotin operon repressor